MFRIAKNLLPQTLTAQSHLLQRRQFTKTNPTSKKQLEPVDIPDEIEEVVTIKCVKRKMKPTRVVIDCPGPASGCGPPSSCSAGGGAAVAEGPAQMSGFGDRDACAPQKECTKFTLQCPQKRPQRPLVRVCLQRSRYKCKLMAAAAVLLAGLVAGYTYMTMFAANDAGKKCLDGNKQECECCTDKEAMICCTFVEEPEE